MDTMTSLESMFLRLEDSHTSLHIASVAVFDGPAPDQAGLVSLFERKLPLVPRYTQRVHEARFHLSAPTWTDDPTFDITYHLRRAAVARPGGRAELEALVGRLMSQQLDRERPLWECWVVDGLRLGRWAMINKVHHCMVDGIAGTDLMALVLDDARNPLPLRYAFASDNAGAHRHATPFVVGALRTLGHPLDLTRSAATAIVGAAHYASLLCPADASSLVGELGAARVWTGKRLPLRDVLAVRTHLGGTVNDVVLCAVTRGFREVLLRRGERLTPHVLRTLVPMSVRSVDGRGHLDNRIAGMVADLPVDLAEPLDRYAAVRARLGAAKRSGEKQAGVWLGRVLARLPQPLVAASLIALFRFPQRFLVTVATNVPGPERPLYALGRRLRELYPYVPIADRLRTGVAVLSYAGDLYVGITADRASTPDIDVLLTGMLDEVTELAALARAAARDQGSARAGVAPAPDAPGAIPRRLAVR
jgi:diacylglycerol O-acyltransferase